MRKSVPTVFHPPSWATYVMGLPFCKSVVANVFLPEWFTFRPCKFAFSAMRLIILPSLELAI